MQALPPHPPPAECVAAEQASKARMYILLSGNAEQIAAAIVDFGPAWRVDTKGSTKDGALARLSHDADLKYKQAGPAVLNAQQRGLSVSVITIPRICEALGR